jgi:hypothetical protein
MIDLGQMGILLVRDELSQDHCGLLVDLLVERLLLDCGLHIPYLGWY